ncbi:hypothetical protein [Niveispirillum sp. KHB5.9]|uniref:hypothetical protein n=1 Tax=Niveispirillum sp. KHB5.9 TaxID=3400269 RepID=UPI003A8931E2
MLFKSLDAEKFRADGGRGSVQGGTGGCGPNDRHHRQSPTRVALMSWLQASGWKRHKRMPCRNHRKTDLVVPLGPGRQVAADIDMDGIVRRPLALVGKSQAEASPVSRSQGQVPAAEYLPQGFRRQPDFTGADNLPGKLKKTFEIIVDRGDQLIAAC